MPAVRAEVFQQLPETAAGSPVVRLVLLHADGLSDVTDIARTCGKRFPNAAVVLLVADMCADCTVRERLFEEGLVQGVVPLTLKLDVWLAAISLLLSGGEYYPPSRQQKAAATPADIVVPTAQRQPDETRMEMRASTTQSTHPVLLDVAGTKSEAANTGAEHQHVSHPVDGLTTRERQILELVSEGHQNKLIAHRMALSEHTVKVHVHNLLTKLRVSNRTQAAPRSGPGLRASLR
ncbi:MAG: response regulator transcription factor [Sphingopyxis sp.]|nr:response regulator transcription factor [Sphingopyxis sp.]